MTNKENHNHIGRIAINPTRLALLAVLSFAAISPTSTVQATCLVVILSVLKITNHSLASMESLII